MARARTCVRCERDNVCRHGMFVVCTWVTNTKIKVSTAPSLVLYRATKGGPGRGRLAHRRAHAVTADEGVDLDRHGGGAAHLEGAAHARACLLAPGEPAGTLHSYGTEYNVRVRYSTSRIPLPKQKVHIHLKSTVRRAPRDYRPRAPRCAGCGRSMPYQRALHETSERSPLFVGRPCSHVPAAAFSS